MPRLACRSVATLGFTVAAVWIALGCSTDRQERVACDSLSSQKWISLQAEVRNDPSAGPNVRAYAEALQECDYLDGWQRERLLTWLGPASMKDRSSAQWFIGGDDDAEFLSVSWDAEGTVTDVSVSPRGASAGSG